MTTYLATAAATWGVAMAVSPLLQIRAIRRHQSSRGVSVAYQQVLLVGFLLWLSYGIALHNVAIIVPNTVATVVCVATIVVSLRYRS
ncbi:MAG: SemiSWEET family sugar transporter [Gaiellaceae bacterium]